MASLNAFSSAFFFSGSTFFSSGAGPRPPLPFPMPWPKDGTVMIAMVNATTKTLDNIIVNPAGSQGQRFLMCSVAIESDDPKALDLLREHEIELRDRVITMLAKQTLDRLTAESARDSLRGELLAGATLEPEAADMDVHAIHQGFLRGMRRHGGVLACDAAVVSLQHDGQLWQVRAGDGRQWQARTVLNAAGAWADVMGALAGAQPIGLQPCRRSALVFTPPPGLAVHDWPMTYSAAEDWYFKPDAGMLLASPANADPVPPHDVQPEELDIALALYQIGEMTTLQVRRPQRTWAGLRSFVADGGLVGGADTRVPQFIWVAAQGGYGIQTAAAMGQACAALARGLDLPDNLSAQGLDAAMLSPARLVAG